MVFFFWFFFSFENRRQQKSPLLCGLPAAPCLLHQSLNHKWARARQCVNRKGCILPFIMRQPIVALCSLYGAYKPVKAAHIIALLWFEVPHYTLQHKPPKHWHKSHFTMFCLMYFTVKRWYKPPVAAQRPAIAARFPISPVKQQVVAVNALWVFKSSSQPFHVSILS